MSFFTVGRPAPGTLHPKLNHQQQLHNKETGIMRYIDVHRMADAANFNRFHALVLAWAP